MPAISLTDLNNAKVDVDHIGAIATSAAPTATDRLGNTKKTIAGIVAAGQMALSVEVHATTAAGLAATTNGKYFSVPSADSSESLILYKNVTGAAVEQKRYPSAAAVAPAMMKGAVSMGITEQLGVRNLFDLSARTPSTVIFNSGTVAALGNFYLTGYMPVIAGGTVTFSQSLTGAGAAYGVHFFDGAKVYLSTGAVQVANVPVAVPAGAAYARANFNNGAHASLMAVQGSTIPAAYLPFGLLNPGTLKRQSQKLAQAYIKGTENLYDPTKITNGKFLQDGAEVTTGIGFITNYMPVTPGGLLTMAFGDPAFTTSYEIGFYDEDKVYLTGAGVYGPYTDGQVVAVPDRAFYARRSYTTAFKEKAVFLDGNVTPIGPWQQYYKPYATELSKWAGKNVVMFGDSLSNNFGTLWPPIVCKRLAANFYLNLTDGGQRYDSALSAHTNGTASAVNIAASDLCFIGYGTNDFRVGTPIGTISDSAATATFYGYMRKVFEQILTWNPSIRIGVWTPPKISGWQTPVGSGGPLNAYADAIKVQAAVYGIPVLDMFNQSQLSDFSIPTLAPDGIHPLQAHQLRLFGNPVEGFLRSI